MTSIPLKRGDHVVLLDDRLGEVEVEIAKAGPFGFSIKGRAAVRRWEDRGKTWRSDILDRRDEVAGRFNRFKGQARTR